MSWGGKRNHSHCGKLTLDRTTIEVFVDARVDARVPETPRDRAIVRKGASR
jgi:hypothetical protein